MEAGERGSRRGSSVSFCFWRRKQHFLVMNFYEIERPWRGISWGSRISVVGFAFICYEFELQPLTHKPGS